MSLKDRLKSYFRVVEVPGAPAAPVVQSAPSAPTAEAQQALADGGFYGGGWLDPDDHLYRPLTGSPRDVSGFTLARAQQLSFYLWDTNPFAKRILELERDIICGDRFRVETQDEDLQRALNQHWKDPQNKWDFFLPQYCLEWKIWGEQLWPVTINPINGRVMLGYIDPSNIKAVRKHPTNQKFEGEVVLRTAPGETEKILKVILPDMDIASKSYGRLNGEAFFFKKNSVIGATRGRPDLFSLVDWMDGYDKMLFDQLERVGLLNAFIWDVTLKGYDQTRVNEWLRNRKTPPRSGSVRAHNDNETWQAVAPSLNSEDVSTGARMIKNHILGSRNLPEHFFAEGGNVNRATAGEMDFPTIKALGRQQADLKHIITTVMEFVRDQAILAKEIRETEEGKTITVQAPEISTKDIQRIGNTMNQVVQSMAVAREKGWATDEQCVKITCAFFGQLGVDCSPDEAMDLIDDVPAGEMVDYLKLAERARRGGLAG